MKKVWVLALLCGLLAAGKIQAAGEGTVGADFLKIGLGARAVGMGEAVTAVVNGVEGMFWNVGGLSKLNKLEATFMRLEYFEDISLNNLAYGQRIGNYGVVGMFVESLDLGKIERTEIDGSGNLLDQGDSFKASNLVLGLGYSLSLGEKHGAGVVFKGIQGKIDNETASSFAADLGWTYDFRENLQLGAAVQNIGGEFKYVSEGDKLPLRVRAGVGYKLIEGLLLGADVVSEVNENKTNGNLGVEYTFKELAALRVGYNSERVNSLGGGAGLSVGAGFKYQNYNIDYGFVPYGDLGNSHRVSLGVKF
ncbi:MAG: PorV/PorQ family protein [Elusimicrobiota bacterium]